MTANLSKVHNLAWRKFLTAHTVLIDQIEQDLAAADLPPLGWYDVLFALSQASEHKLRLHELAQAVLLSRSNITRLVDRLESKGLLQREQCSRDRRGAFAVITQAGFAMLERMWTVYESAITRDFACHLNVADVKLFIKILNKITSSSNSEPEN
ncbi:MAG: MarR family transcriptional regulator [Leptolyngbyaceae cyanobacterium SM1_1_3]|nr:MarR family transcriptional regulator [Leptolyngbyaceae cyanobacterium SM1_1_3]NJN04131.1 MarR family transcriptional regulator [Leptolyngbyaceae cyanobacterium RM1_1_2]NJO11401.1 MarR family transcriptional regulator [Leptolyngbyaceae cyanobacterium SL_1_1]